MVFHPRDRNRRCMRLRGWDYSSPGRYFVTICVKNKECFLADSMNGKIVPNEYGKIVESRWLWLQNQYPYVEVEAFAIMPNHFHGLIRISKKSVGTGRDLSLPAKIKSLSDIIGAFKTTTSKDIHLAGFVNFFWQRSFFERIVRSEVEAKEIKQYIENNLSNWDHDDENKLSED